MKRAAPSLWYDVTNLVSYSGTVTGIERAISGVARGLLEADAPVPVRFCHFRKGEGFFELQRPRLDALLDELGRERSRRKRTLAARLRKRLLGSRPASAPFDAGDVLLNLGYATYQQRHRPLVAELFQRSGVNYAGFIYDLLPVRFPEWWDPEEQIRTREWFTFTGRHASIVLCCSVSTSTDVRRFFEEEGIEAGPVVSVPLADDLRVSPAAGESSAGTERPYVLYVSTLEVRKNHRLLFQVWKELLRRHEPSAVPNLVLVGRKGWLIGDFLAELRNAHFLGGKIVVRHAVSDEELARLYADCLFTVYPSIHEGWGLPIAESLAHGKYCVASSSSSIPEVGGDLIDYHDPFDLRGALERIERAIFDPAYRAAKEAEIRARYRRRTWRESAQAIVAALAPLWKPPASA